MRKKIIIGLILVLVTMQFFRPDLNNPEINPEIDYVEIVQSPNEISEILKTSCYDCHSNETKHPWYMQVAPVSWWTSHHVDEGREELNFSEWGNYSLKRKKHKLKECVEMIEENEMPLNSYTWTHSEATLSNEQKTALTTWFKKG